DAEANVQDVAILDDIVLALQTEEAFRARIRHGAGGHQIVVRDHLGPDEAAFQIGMNLAGRLRRLGPPTYRPGAYLIFTSRQEADQVQQLITSPDDLVQRRFLDVQFL